MVKEDEEVEEVAGSKEVEEVKEDEEDEEDVEKNNHQNVKQETKENINVQHEKEKKNVTEFDKPPRALTEAAIKDMTVKKLNIWCNKYRLSTKGRKHEVATRLIKFITNK